MEAAFSIGRTGFVGRPSLSSRVRRFAGCVSDWINPAKVRSKSLGATTLGMYPVCCREFLRCEAMRRSSTNTVQHVQSVTSLQGQQSEVSTSQGWHKNLGCQLVEGHHNVPLPEGHRIIHSDDEYRVGLVFLLRFTLDSFLDEPQVIRADLASSLRSSRTSLVKTADSMNTMDYDGTSMTTGCTTSRP